MSKDSIKYKLLYKPFTKYEIRSHFLLGPAIGGLIAGGLALFLYWNHLLMFSLGILLTISSLWLFRQSVKKVE